MPACTLQRLKNCDPGPVSAFVVELSTFNSGISQDVFNGGYYQVKNGVRTLRSTSKLIPALPGHIVYLIQRLKEMGVERISAAPYEFGWANSYTVSSGGGGALTAPGTDGRRTWPVLRPPPGAFVTATLTGPEILRKAEEMNPDIWPRGRVWKAHAIPGRPGAGIDLPDEITAARDLFYYRMWLRTLSEQFPGLIDRVIPQLSNCVQGLLPSDAWLNIMATALPAANAEFGFPPDIQIEGCNATMNASRGHAWDAPVADCPAYKAIAKSPETLISMWPTSALNVVGKDFATCAS